MKTINSPVKFMAYCIAKSVRHPRTPISLPDRKEISAIPWWGSILCIVVGIGAWIASALLNIAPLGEASRLLVYAPLGHLFSSSMRRG